MSFAGGALGQSYRKMLFNRSINLTYWNVCTKVCSDEILTMSERIAAMFHQTPGTFQICRNILQNRIV